MKNFMMRSLTAIPMICGLLVMAPSLGQQVAGPGAPVAEGGHGVGNSGDAVEKDGRLVLRDFSGESKIVLDNPSFLGAVPGLTAVIKDIGKVDASIALRLWVSLAKARIFTTNQYLPLLDPSETGLSYDRIADLQVAIRNGNKIVISLPALSRLAEEYKKWLFVHEALHGLIPGSGSDHHVKVRSLTAYLAENQDRYTAKNLARVFQKAGAVIPQAEEISDEARKFFSMGVSDLLRAVFLEEGTFESRCAVVRMAADLHKFFHRRPHGRARLVDASPSLSGFVELLRSELEGMETWGDYPQCDREMSPEEFLSSRVVEFDLLSDKLFGPIVVDVSFVRNDLKATQAKCNKWAGADLQHSFETVDKNIALGKRVSQKILQEIRSDDALYQIANQLAVASLPYDFFGRGPYVFLHRPVNDIEDGFRKRKEVFTENVKKCSSWFRKDADGSWVKRP